MTKRLIEEWFPAAQVGAESLRERGSPKAFPPVNFIHTWWARRPLVASRAAILLSLLPAWPDPEAAKNGAPIPSDTLAKHFPEGKTQYYAWVTKALGIRGDPDAARKQIQKAVAAGKRTKGNAYGTARAFTVTPDHLTLEIVADLIGEQPTILDPFSGGGSIPFESMRYGFETIANELNAVASAILSGTIDLPFRYGHLLQPHIEHYGMLWAKRVEPRLAPYFPTSTNEPTKSYIWAHTVPCPTTGHPTPLAPNLWMANGDGRQIALELIPNSASGKISIVVHSGESAKTYGEKSTFKNGIGVSVWDNGTFDGSYIGSCAYNGTMGEMLLAVVIDKGKGRDFRTPNEADLAAVAAAREALQESLPSWEAQDLIPSEDIPPGYTTDQPRRMAITRWRDMFTSRQLLANITILEELRIVTQKAITEIGCELGKAVALYLALSFDRMMDYNSRLTTWESTFNKIAHVFADHNFAFTTSFAEFEAARELVPWSASNQAYSYEKLLRLIPPSTSLLEPARSPRAATIINGSATDLATVADKSVDAVITDPPYGKNVMYAESSDFFYVWLKRALRDTWPEFCTLDLTDKHREVVANPSLFRDVATRKGPRNKEQRGHTAAELAKRNYDRLLTDSFKEAHRVLKDDGIMTVMFTNKEVDMWDTLGVALLDSGFTIESSWPVASESNISLRIAKKNAAQAAIFLACRKRQSAVPSFWADIKNEISETTEHATTRFASDGLSGIDLTVATYGPALSILSHHWPVYTGNINNDGTDEIISPEAALNLAREKVSEIKKRGLLDGRSMAFDRPTDWYLIAWSDFRAREFPAAEALKLSMAMHLDLDALRKTYRLCTAKSGWATLLTPEQRRAAGAVKPGASVYPYLVDALHALILVFEEEGLSGARAWLSRTRLGDNEKFKAVVAGAIKAIPRVKKNGVLVIPEAKTLELIRATLFETIPAPADDAEQLVLV
jgi:adenine-specific DNA methylase